VLQCVVVRCSAVQCVAVRSGALQCATLSRLLKGHIQHSAHEQDLPARATSVSVHERDLVTN